MVLRARPRPRRPKANAVRLPQEEARRVDDARLRPVLGLRADPRMPTDGSDIVPHWGLPRGRDAPPGFAGDMAPGAARDARRAWMETHGMRDGADPGHGGGHAGDVVALPGFQCQSVDVIAASTPTLTSTTVARSEKLSITSDARVCTTDGALSNTQDFAVDVASSVFNSADMELASIHLADGHLTPAQRTIEPTWNRVYVDQGVPVTATRRALEVSRVGGGAHTLVALPLTYAAILGTSTFEQEIGGVSTLMVRLRGTEPLMLGDVGMLDAYAESGHPVELRGVSTDPLILTSANVLRAEADGALVMLASDLDRLPFGAPGQAQAGTDAEPVGVLLAPRPPSPAHLAQYLTRGLRHITQVSVGAKVTLGYIAGRDQFRVQLARADNAVDLGTAGRRHDRLGSTVFGPAKATLARGQQSLASARYTMGGDDLAAYMGLRHMSILVDAGVKHAEQWSSPRVHCPESFLEVPPGNYDTPLALTQALDAAARRTVVENGTPPLAEPAGVCSQGTAWSGAGTAGDAGTPPPPQTAAPPVAGGVGLPIGFDIRPASAAVPLEVRLPPGTYSTVTLLEEVQQQLDVEYGAGVVKAYRSPLGPDDGSLRHGIAFTSDGDASLQVDFRGTGSGERFGYAAEAVVVGEGDTVLPTFAVPHIPADCDGAPFPCGMRVQVSDGVPGGVVYVAQRPPPLSVPDINVVTLGAAPHVNGMAGYRINWPDGWLGTGVRVGARVRLTQTATPDFTDRITNTVVTGVIVEVTSTTVDVRVHDSGPVPAVTLGATMHMEFMTMCALNLYTVPTQATPRMAWASHVGVASLLHYAAAGGVLCGNAALDVGAVPFVYVALFLDEATSGLGHVRATPAVAGGVVFARGTAASGAAFNSQLPRYEGALNTPRYFAVLLNKQSMYNLDLDRAFGHHFTAVDRPGAFSRVRVALYNPNHTPYQTHGTQVHVSLRLHGAFRS